MDTVKIAGTMLFLSTLSLRRATSHLSKFNTSQRVFLSTLSLRRATREPTALRTPHQRFLSTLSLRRATLIEFRKLLHPGNFYPRSPCGERHCFRVPYRLKVTISIHALLAESDVFPCIIIIDVKISIHALLAESDVVDTVKIAGAMLFLSTLSLRRATFLANPC